MFLNKKSLMAVAKERDGMFLLKEETTATKVGKFL